MTGTISGFEIDTAFFTGNHAPRISIQGSSTGVASLQLSTPPGTIGTCPTTADWEQVEAIQSDQWTTIVPMTVLGCGNQDTRKNYVHIHDDILKNTAWTHLRLNLFPDGGVARLRIYGTVVIDWKTVVEEKAEETCIDLVARHHGGCTLAFSDAHYGYEAKSN